MSALTKFGVIPSQLQGEMWLNGWSYGKEIIIPANKIDDNLVNFPLRVYLDKTNFDFSLCKSDESDLRFTDASLNQLKFERQQTGIISAFSADLCTGGTVLKSSEYSTTYAASKAFDDNNTTFWRCNTTGAGTYIGYQFTTAQNIARITYMNYGTTSYNPTAVAVDYSDNGTTWTQAGSDFAVLSTINIWQNLDIVDVGAHVYWRLRSVTLGAYVWRMYECQMLSATLSTGVAVYNVQVPLVSNTEDTKIYLWYGNANAYNTSIESWQDQTKKALNYVGNINLKAGIESDRRVAYLDGTGDYFTLNGQSDFALGTGDFCIEMLIKPAVLNTTENKHLLDFRPTGQTGFYPSPCLSADNRIRYFTNNTEFILGTTVLQVGTLYHLCWIRSGGVTKAYLNGVQEGVDYTDTNNYIVGASRPTIGGQGFTVGTNMFNGYYYGIRVTKGRARQTSNFTPPTSFDIDGNDVIFCTNFDTIYDGNYAMVQHMGDSLIDATGNNNSGTATGTTVINTDYGKARSFATATDAISYPATTIALDGAAINFTALSLIQDTSLSYVSMWSKGAAATDGGFQFGIRNTNPYPFIAFYSDDLNADIPVTIGNYNVIAGIIVGSTKEQTVYCDGVAILTRTSTGNLTATNDDALIVGRSATLNTGGSFMTVSESRFSSIVRSEAWIKAESLNLKGNLFTVNNIAEFLADINIIEVTTSIDITNLNLNKGDELLLVCDFINDTISTSLYGLSVNGNNISTNYYTQSLYGTGTTIGGLRANTNSISNANLSKESISETFIKLVNSGYFTYRSYILNNLGTTCILLELYGASTFTITDITQLTITATSANAIGVGSRIQLYRIGRGL